MLKPTNAPNFVLEPGRQWRSYDDSTGCGCTRTHLKSTLQPTNFRNVYSARNSNYLKELQLPQWSSGSATAGRGIRPAAITRRVACNLQLASSSESTCSMSGATRSRGWRVTCRCSGCITAPGTGGARATIRTPAASFAGRPLTHSVSSNHISFSLDRLEI